MLLGDEPGTPAVQTSIPETEFQLLRDAAQQNGLAGVELLENYSLDAGLNPPQYLLKVGFRNDL